MTLEEIIKTRRSVREFLDKPIPKEVIMKLLDMARWAPYACECWRFVIVQDEERKKAVAEAASEQHWIATAPVVIVVGADIEGKGERSINLYCVQDTAAAIQNLMLTAVKEELGTCWIGSFDERGVADIVGFPETVEVMAVVPVGYPKKPQIMEGEKRRPLEEIVFWETYE